MEVFEAVSYIRKSKNISLADTLGNELSKSSYYRYINGDSDLYSQNFLNILYNLRISLDEVNLMRTGYKEQTEQTLLIKVKQAFDAQNVEELKMLKKHCRILAESEANIVFAHLHSLVELLVNRLLKKNIDVTKTEIFQYLIKTETWSRYELVLFNNSLFYFDSEAVNQILPRAIDKLINFQKMNPYANEAVILLANAIIFFLKEKNEARALHYIDTANQLYLTEEQAYERLLIKCLSSIKKIVLNNSEGFEEITVYLKIMETLEMNNLLEMFNKLISELETVY